MTGDQRPASPSYRLVCGRLDPAHTPPLGTTDVDLDELRARFPGFGHQRYRGAVSARTT